MPTTGQLVLLAVAIIVFAGAAASLTRLRGQRAAMPLLARLGLVLGIVLCLGLIVWRMIETQRWVPLGDNCDAMVSLAMLLALFVLYVQRSAPLGGLDWFVMPVVELLLVLALLFGSQKYAPYAPLVQGTWLWVHYATSFLGAAAFAIAAAAGAMYVLTSRKLRHKALVGPQFGNLERLERLTMTTVIFGFALLTIGAVTGVVWMVESHKHTSPLKLGLATAAWVVYAIVLHSPIHPSFRGRKVAILSIFGFVLMVGTVLAVLLTGGTSGISTGGHP